MGKLLTIRNLVNLEELLIDVKMIMSLTLVVYFEKVSFTSEFKSL